MRGIIMAGGSGKRLSPLTAVVNKQLLPIFDKPLIFYPLTTLMLAGIREILLISNRDDIFDFQKLFSNGSQYGLSIQYAIQESPKGVADGFLVAQDFINGSKVCLILGDNFFYGHGVGRQFSQYMDVKGAQIFAYPVLDAQNYGVVVIDKNGKLIGIEEKPKDPKSNLAVTGLYFYDEKVVDLTKSLKPSKRSELEITDLNKAYFALGELNVTLLPMGTAWLDTGTFSGIHDAGSFVRILQERQNTVIGDPLIVARAQGWI
jgi:glucose-1-phosphate thymidylyltransferase